MNAILEIVPGGCFVATPATIGSTHAELEAWARGVLEKERVAEIEATLRSEAFKLNCRPVEGMC